MGQLILEGPDGAGKTTLAKMLDAAPIVRASAKQINEVWRGVSWTDAWFYPLRTPGRVIYDRFHLSQVVYTKVYNRPSFSETERFMVDAWTLAHGAILVMCMPPVDIMEQNIRNGEHNVPSHVSLIDKLPDVIREFNEAAARTALPVIWYDYTSGDRPTLNQLREVMINQPSLYGGTGVGSLNPRTILVGDHRSDLSRPGDLPFCSSRALHSGSYLLDALSSAGLTARDVFITNAYEPSRRIGLYEELAQVDSLDIVALGNNASAELSFLGVRHRKIPHPQWWRRFRYNDVKEYGRAIANA